MKTDLEDDSTKKDELEEMLDTPAENRSWTLTNLSETKTKLPDCWRSVMADRIFPKMSKVVGTAHKNEGPPQKKSNQIK